MIALSPMASEVILIGLASFRNAVLPVVVTWRRFPAESRVRLPALIVVIFPTKPTSDIRLTFSWSWAAILETFSSTICLYFSPISIVGVAEGVETEASAGFANERHIHEKRRKAVIIIFFMLLR